MQKILDILLGSAIFTVNCWSWDYWHLGKELLWKNTGKNNKTILIKMLNWPTKGVKYRRQYWFCRILCLRGPIYKFCLLGCIPHHIMFDYAIQCRVLQTSVKDMHILFSYGGILIISSTLQDNVPTIRNHYKY